jgi:hypothetical protein
MDRIAGQELIVENAETEINGDISLVDGKIGKAVTSEYILFCSEYTLKPCALLEK